MDFVVGLPRTPRRMDSIWVVVDRFTKCAHFIPIKTTFSVVDYANIYIKEIVRLHDIPETIVSDHDAKFVSYFWRSLHQGLKTKLNFSTAFHPQTDRQSERTVCTLEDMLRSCMLVWKGTWEEH